MTRILPNPAIASTPNTDKVHRRSRIAQISRNGEGRASIAQRMTKNTKTSHKVIVCPLIWARTIALIMRPGIVIIPSPRRISKIMMIAIAIPFSIAECRLF